MKVRLSVTTAASELPWEVVLTPGRSLVYGVLGRLEPTAGRRLHERGVGEYGMVPFGHGAPVFPKARRVRGRYAAGGSGTVEFGSPVPQLAETLRKGFAERELLDWGGVALRLTRIEVIPPPAFSSGRARFRTSTPVVMKGDGRVQGEHPPSRQHWVLPGQAQWVKYMQGNLVRKAETLGLDPAVRLEEVTWVGASRSFRVRGGVKPGAPVEVELSGPPETLRAVWSWGLGQANSAGFGWISPHPMR
ncbi:hypothetical protein GCM10027160_00610 [Streptomyces calidiresistens]|uniref:CRISPR-associated protein Cas6 n=1 Tax=Streptomyces calidiresistens TaxID=1485586 RepID=A0A7W3SZR8_9ACTN|nr:CRISPR-associated endoribonuclease Cas6 [Streptomyces calidiresistens]MBB0228329.1 CRISPR-associated protein Cas6 [Streptomyces calidiresistens]